MSVSRLVGRDVETAQLATALADAEEHGAAMVVTGAPGVGKTSLLEHISARAQSQGASVLSVTGLKTEAELPYAGLHQLLQPVLRSATELPAPQKNALLTALGMATGTTPEVFLVALATLNLIVDVAEDKPLVLIADDAQWIDVPTSTVLTFVARRLESTRILAIFGLREGFQSAIQSLRLPEIHVGPLSDSASNDLLTSVDPELDNKTRRLILDEALGNPLALVELDRAFRLHGAQGSKGSRRRIPLTDRLERTFSAEAQQLPKLTQSALLLSAMDDEPTISEVVGAVRAQAGQDATIEVLRPALEAGLISMAGSAIRFRHPLIRSAVDQAATPIERRSAHLALAKVMVDTDRRAWHRARAALGEDDGAASDLEATAQRAEDRGAIPAALAALELSATLTSHGPTKARRLMRAAEFGIEVGDLGAVSRLLDSAAGLELTSKEMARMVWLREDFLGGVPGGDASHVHRLVTWARKVAPDDLSLALELLRSAAVRCWWTDPGAGARALVIGAVEQLGDDRDSRVLEILALAAPIDMGARISRLVRETAGAVDDSSRLGDLASAAFAVGDMSLSIEMRDRTAPMLRAQGRLGNLSSLLVVRAWGEINVGHFGAAIRDADEGNRLAVETGQPIWISMSPTARGILLALRGEQLAAQQLILDAGSPLAGFGVSILASQRELALGIAAMTEGSMSQAADHFARMLDPAGPAYHEVTATGAAPYVVECAVRAGRADDARRILATLEGLATLTPAPMVHIGVRFGRAVLAEESEAERFYKLALDAEPRWPFHHARLQMAFGSWLRRQRRIIESRPHLRASRDTFEALGVRPWANKARAELRASGERAAEPVPPSSQPLSPQEWQIAHMAATGLSNREIADRLFLSHRTVGAHLYRVFPKLGITSRSELAQVLAVLEPALAS